MADMNEGADAMSDKNDPICPASEQAGNDRYRVRKSEHGGTDLR